MYLILLALFVMALVAILAVLGMARSRKPKPRRGRRTSSAAPKRSYRRRSGRRRSRGFSKPSIGLADVAVGAFAMERFGVFDALENLIGTVMDILKGDEVNLDTLKADAMNIIAPIRANAKLSNALQVGAAGGAVGLIRRIIPGSSGTLATIPNGIPLVGGMRIRRF